MPWLEANGLLPGRGAPLGLPTGRGDGAFGVAEAAGASGSAGGAVVSAVSAAGASGSAAAAFFGPGLGADGASAAGSATGSATGSVTGAAGSVTRAAGSAAGAAASGSAAAFLAGARGPGLAGASAGAAGAADFSDSPTSLRKRISAGSSTVELADLTNSPISLNFSRTNLLSTPNSLASS